MPPVSLTYCSEPSQGLVLVHFSKLTSSTLKSEPSTLARLVTSLCPGYPEYFSIYTIPRLALPSLAMLLSEPVIASGGGRYPRLSPCGLQCTYRVSHSFSTHPRASFSYLFLQAHTSSLASGTVHSLTSETNSKNLCESLGSIHKRYSSLWPQMLHLGISNLAVHCNHLGSFQND